MSDNLDRNLGLFEVIAISMGSMIGSGIFILPGVAFLEVGTASVVLAFLVGGVLTIPTALSSAEMATAIPESGGSYLYIQRGMGSLLGTIAGIGNWLVLNFKTALALVGGIPYLIFIIPAIKEINLFGFEPIILLSVVLTVLFTMLNAFSSESAGKAQNIIVGLMLVALALVLVGSTPNVVNSNPSEMFNFGGGGFFATIALVFISYAGVIKVTSVAEEIENPGRNIPLGIIISLAITTFVYVAITYVTVYTLDIAYLASNVPLAEGGLSPTGEGAIIAIVAQETLGQIGAVIVVIAALLALASTANSGILSASRYPYSMAKDDLAPSEFMKISPQFNTPVYSILATGALVIILVVFFPIDSIARFGGAFQVVVFILVNVALIGFREGDVDYYSPDYTTPLYPYMQIFGILSGLALLTQMGLVALIGSILIVGISIGYYYLYVARQSPEEGEVKEEIREDIHSQALEDTQKILDQKVDYTILVALKEKHTDKQKDELIDIAKSLATENRGVDIRVVKFSSKLKSTLNELGPTILTNEPDWVQEYSNLSFEQVSSQEPKKAIVEYSRYNGANLILQTYEESQGHLYKLNSELQWTLENAPCESLVLDAEEFTSAEKISVISTKEYYVPTKLAVADSICQTHNAVLDLVQVVPETASDAQVESIENYHTELESSLKSKTTTSILKTSNGLVEEVKTYTTDSDLIIASIDISTIRKRVFGSTSSRMARDINVPLLLVYSEYQYRYHTIYKRILMKYLFRGF